jgi:putative transposase
MDSAGVKLLRLPARSPNLNAVAGRFVRSIRQECLLHIVPLGENHLRRTDGEFVAHYHSERNHQGLGNVIPFPARESPDAPATVVGANASADFSITMNESPLELPD